MHFENAIIKQRKLIHLISFTKALLYLYCYFIIFYKLYVVYLSLEILLQPRDQELPEQIHISI